MAVAAAILVGGDNGGCAQSGVVMTVFAACGGGDDESGCSGCCDGGRCLVCTGVNAIPQTAAKRQRGRREACRPAQDM